MSFYDPDLLEELECPVCTDYMHPPIRQCELGHSICDRCFLRVRTCPVCRAPRGRARSLALETLQARLVFPCKNRIEGCRFIDLGPYIVDHEIFCQYGAIPCLLKGVNHCTWYGPMSGMMAHCRSRHPSHVHAANQETITCGNFIKDDANLLRSSFHSVFEAHSEVFKCVWDVNYETSLMRWCVFYVGIERSPKDFSYEINVENHNNSSEKLSIKATCKHYKQEQNTFGRNLCMFTNYEMLKKFCNGNALKYRVKITRNYVYG